MEEGQYSHEEKKSWMAFIRQEEERVGKGGEKLHET
jgi:hypothetical protein